LFEIDFDWSGFRWIEVNDKASNVLAFSRIAKNGSEMICVFNFSPVGRKDYKIIVPPGMYQTVFATKGHSTKKMRSESDKKGSYLKVDVAPLSAMFIKKTLNEFKV